MRVNRNYVLTEYVLNENDCSNETETHACNAFHDLFSFELD